MKNDVCCTRRGKMHETQRFGWTAFKRKCVLVRMLGGICLLAIILLNPVSVPRQRGTRRPCMCAPHVFCFASLFWFSATSRLCVLIPSRREVILPSTLLCCVPLTHPWQKTELFLLMKHVLHGEEEKRKARAARQAAVEAAELEKAEASGQSTDGHDTGPDGRPHTISLADYLKSRTSKDSSGAPP